MKWKKRFVYRTPLRGIIMNIKKVGKVLLIGIKWFAIAIAILIFYYLSWPDSYQEFFGIFYVIYDIVRGIFT